MCLAGRKEEAAKKYPGLESKIQYFISNDPTGNLKYLDWELKILQSGQAMEDEILDVVKLFERFGRNLPKKDIYQYQVSEFTNLRDELFKINDLKQKTQQNTEVNEEAIACGNKDVYNQDKVKVKLIFNRSASMHYGQGTKWCITMKDRGYFENYMMNNVVFFFVLNNNLKNTDPHHKIAVAFIRDEKNVIKQVNYYDSMDTMIDASVIHRISPNIIPVITPIAESFPKSILSKISSGEANHKEISEALSDKEMLQNQDAFSRVVDKICSKYKDNLPPAIIDQMLSSPFEGEIAPYSILEISKNISSPSLKKLIAYIKKSHTGSRNGIGYPTLGHILNQDNILPEDIEEIYNSIPIYKGALEEFVILMQTPAPVLIKIFNTIETDEYKNDKDVSYKIKGMIKNILNHPNCPSELIDNYLAKNNQNIESIREFGGYGDHEIVEAANEEMKLSNKEYLSYARFTSSLGFYDSPRDWYGVINHSKLKAFRNYFTPVFQALSPRLKERFIKKDMETLRKGYGSAGQNIEVLEDTTRLFM